MFWKEPLWVLGDPDFSPDSAVRLLCNPRQARRLAFLGPRAVICKREEMLPPTSRGPAGIKWQIEWERVWKRVGAARGKVSCKGSDSRQKALAPQGPGLGCGPATQPPTPCTVLGTK